MSELPCSGRVRISLRHRFSRVVYSLSPARYATCQARPGVTPRVLSRNSGECAVPMGPTSRRFGQGRHHDAGWHFALGNYRFYCYGCTITTVRSIVRRLCRHDRAVTGLTGATDPTIPSSSLNSGAVPRGRVTCSLRFLRSLHRHC